MNITHRRNVMYATQCVNVTNINNIEMREIFADVTMSRT
jgi:hypothetical protein